MMPYVPQNVSFQTVKGAESKSSLAIQHESLGVQLLYVLQLGDPVLGAPSLHDQPLHGLAQDALWKK
jgi:hypothetical protein